MKIKFANKALLLKIILPTAILLILAIQIYTLVSTVNVLKLVRKETQNAVATYAAHAPMLSKDALYCLYECGGKIGIYDAKSSILIDVVDVFTSSLPHADRQALKKGIEIYSFSDLSKIIDDFSS